MQEVLLVLLVLVFLLLLVLEPVLPRDVYTPMVLLVVVLVAQQCSGMKVIQGFAVEIFADVYTKVARCKF